MEPLISVIVPVYNVEKYLCECVDSIINQTYKNLEIILVDDGSPDNCGKICDDYAKKDNRIKVIHKENGGLSDARNAGMDASVGEYLVFVDSDDYMTNDGIEYMYNLISSVNADIAIGGVERFNDLDKSVMSSTYNGVIDEKVMDKIDAMKDVFLNGCASWARIYKRNIHKEIYFPIGEINEDEAIVLNLLDRCDKIVKSNLIVYKYRFRPNSITSVDFSVKKLAWYYHCKTNLDFVKKEYPELIEYAEKRCYGAIIFSLYSISQLNKEEFKNVLPTLLNDFKSKYRFIQKNRFLSRRAKNDAMGIMKLGVYGYGYLIKIFRGIKSKIKKHCDKF